MKKFELKQKQKAIQAFKIKKQVQIIFKQIRGK